MVSLSTTKVELNAAVMGVHGALFMKNILKSPKLKVKLPILIMVGQWILVIITLLAIEHVS